MAEVINFFGDWGAITYLGEGFCVGVKSSLIQHHNSFAYPLVTLTNDSAEFVGVIRSWSLR